MDMNKGLYCFQNPLNDIVIQFFSQVPQQPHNSNNCGIYISLFMKYFLQVQYNFVTTVHYGVKQL